LPTHNAIAKKAKEPPSQRTKTAVTMDRNSTTERTPACNSGLAKVAVQCSADIFPAEAGQVVVNQTLVLRMGRFVLKIATFAKRQPLSRKTLPPGHKCSITTKNPAFHSVK